jgi:hypothetical protein
VIQKVAKNGIFISRKEWIAAGEMKRHSKGLGDLYYFYI